MARDLDRDLSRALARLGSAWAALADGRAEQAAIAAGAAAEVLDHLGYRAFHARALDVLGRALAAAGRAAEAAEALGGAAAIFDACGAGWRREAAERAMIVAGAGRKGAE